MKEIEYPKFLPNTPIGADLFEGKSQDKIAEVISVVITNNNFQVVGIDGAWGTGKSNLVEIIKTKLTNYNFFMYDVWGHQEDDQRKAILVELTEFISCEKRNLVANKNKWNGKLKKLLAREKEVTTINRPYLSVGFIFSLFSIIYIPTVNTFAKTSENQTTIFGIESTLGKLIIILFPIFLILAIYIVKLVFQLCNGGKWNSFKIALQETFQVYNNKQVDETKIETISENEPTVRDFRNWLKEIDTDLKDKKVILVFDNFDRLPRKHILSIWSSIHIFFAEEKYKNIKVIIPFDRLHIKNAFRELESEQSDTDYANDYINKTFDLVYRVSQPILSDWKDFFKTKWLNAFGKIDEEEYLKVLQVYETFREKITPREIIACINEIVSIKLLNDSIPDRYIAIFVLNKDEILESPLKAISIAKFLKGLDYLYKEDEDFQKHITALAYQIKPDNALEVVYTKQLKDCIINSKNDIFKEISKTTIFDKIIDSVIHELSNNNNLILVLDKIEEDAKISKIHLKSIWNGIYLKMVNSFHDGFDIVEYQMTLVKNIEKEKAEVFISKILDKLLNHDTFVSDKFSKMIDELQDYIVNQNIEINVFDILNEKPVKKIDAISFINLVKQKNDKYLDYKLSTDESKLNEHLVSLEAEDLRSAEYLKIINKDFGLNNFEKEVREKIEQYKNDSDSITFLVNALKYISDKPLELVFGDNEIYNLFSQTDSSNDFYYDIVCLRLARSNEYNNSYVSYFQSALDDDSEALAMKIAERIEFYIDFDDFLINGEHFSNSLLYKNVASHLINNLSENDNRYILKSLLIHFEDICNSLEVEPNNLFLKLDTFDLEKLNPVDVEEFPVFLFEQIASYDNDLKKYLFDLSNKYFEELSNENWIKLFGDFENRNYALLKVINYKNWSSNSLEAFKSVLSNNITNNVFQDRIEWEFIFNSFKESGLSIVNTLKDIRDILYDNPSYTTVEIFKLLFNPFIEYSILHDKPKEAFRTFFKVQFLNDISILKLLIDNSEKIKELLNMSESSTTVDFKQAIRDKKEENDNIKTLASKLDIRSLKK
jgi:hypothetical protein